MHEGATIHSTFSVPVNGQDSSSFSIPPSSKEASRIRGASLIFLDEASMIPLWMIEYIDIRDITGRINIAFGGMSLSVGGDFKQTLPILESSE